MCAHAGLRACNRTVGRSACRPIPGESRNREVDVRSRPDTGILQVSPSGRFLALLESPKSLLIVELVPVARDGRGGGSASGGVGAEGCSVGARAVLQSESDLTGFGWMRSCECDILADCGAGGLRVWEVASSESPGSSSRMQNKGSSAALHVVSVGRVDGAQAEGRTPPPRALCWHPGGRRVICVTTAQGLRLWTKHQQVRQGHRFRACPPLLRAIDVNRIICNSYFAHESVACQSARSSQLAAYALCSQHCFYMI